ncbi:cytochrome P450 [Amycolatopsis carbonis]|uniref:Cytochrome P450 n=1 Tax=Amycolatopsis carbonis TaxID=715471 RepID=A0A9Y2IPV8_9PSEU|nr:cytochrome P450 [Amycolatopsis sp. 2-15]WIX83236.1 cytochrome P450 [Amycolatopsis sp. 2-15]
MEKDTIGVAGAEAMDAVLRARPATDVERPTFKPVSGKPVERRESSALMQALGHDVRTALKTPLEDHVDLSGEWPLVGHNYLRDLVFGPDPYRLKVLVDRSLELTPKLTWTVVATGAALPGRPQPDDPLSSVAGLTANATGYQQRRRALFLYRRVAGPICFTIAATVTAVLWLGSPFDDDVPNAHLIHEALRMLPPSWNILRRASPEFSEIDSRIGLDDDVLLLPLLSHRDPRLWEAPDEFRPQRWRDLDPETHPGYLPFGHSNERCWGRRMVMPLAERLLDLLRRDGYSVDPRQTQATVPLAGLMEPTGVRVGRHSR